MSAKLIITFKDSLMGAPTGLHYKVLANNKEIDYAVITNSHNNTIRYTFKDKGQQVIILSSNGKQTTISKATSYNIILKIIDTQHNLEKVIGSELLMNNKQLTMIAISPWTKISLGNKDLDPISIDRLMSSQNFFEIEYNQKNTSNSLNTIRIVIKDLPRKIVLTALKYKHSTKWAGNSIVKSTHPILNKTVIYKENTNKCNVFVNDVLTEAGISVAWIEHGKSVYVPVWKRCSPPTAGEWANKSLLKHNWDATTTPLPGDIGAYAHEYSDASGHVGIIIADGVTISAGWERIEVNDSGFRHKNGTATSNDHDFTVFRRYKGTIK
jgi:hypothetical protein